MQDGKGSFRCELVELEDRLGRTSAVIARDPLAEDAVWLEAAVMAPGLTVRTEAGRNSIACEVPVEFASGRLRLVHSRLAHVLGLLAEEIPGDAAHAMVTIAGGSSYATVRRDRRDRGVAGDHEVLAALGRVGLERTAVVS